MEIQGPSSGAGPINRLIAELNRLPGIGPKSAQRITYYLLRSNVEESRLLAEAITSLKQKTSLCSCCCNVTESDPCPMCSNPTRDQSFAHTCVCPGYKNALSHLSLRNHLNRVISKVEQLIHFLIAHA